MTDIVGAGFGDIVLGRTASGTLSGYVLFGDGAFTLSAVGAGVVHAPPMRVVLSGSGAGVALVSGAGSAPLVLARAAKTTSGPDANSVDLLPFVCDWSEGFIERRSYLTDIISPIDGREQRRAIRFKADRYYQYVITCESPLIASRVMESLIHSASRPMAIPAWPYAARSSAVVNPGDFVIPVTGAASYGFHSHVMLWKSDTQYELLSIASVAANQINTLQPVQGTWASNAVVVPCYIGDVDTQLEPIWHSRDALRVVVSARIRGRDLPSSSGTVGASAGTLTLGLFPDRPGELQFPSNRPVYVMEAPSYGREVYGRSRELGTALPYMAKIFTVADAVELWSWFDGRFGRLNPSWVPSFNQDIELSSSVSSGSSTVVIKHCDFGRAFYATKARRYVALYAGQGSVNVRRVTGVTDGGTTETLQLSATAGVNVTLDRGYIGFAHYARLASDEVEVRWSGPALGESELQFLDVSAEAPAI